MKMMLNSLTFFPVGHKVFFFFCKPIWTHVFWTDLEEASRNPKETAKEQEIGENKQK